MSWCFETKTIGMIYGFHKWITSPKLSIVPTRNVVVTYWALYATDMECWYHDARGRPRLTVRVSRAPRIVYDSNEEAPDRERVHISWPSGVSKCGRFGLFIQRSLKKGAGRIYTGFLRFSTTISFPLTSVISSLVMPVETTPSISNVTTSTPSVDMSVQSPPHGLENGEPWVFCGSPRHRFTNQHHRFTNIDFYMMTSTPVLLSYDVCCQFEMNRNTGTTVCAHGSSLEPTCWLQHFFYSSQVGWPSDVAT